MNALVQPVVPAGRRTVLVVDASRTKRRLVTAHLAPLGFEVREASTVAEGRAALAADGAIDIVVTGWLLPDGAGTDLCRQVRPGGAGGGHVYAILLTGRADGAAEGLDAGADDFVPVPVRGEELRARVRAGARLIDAQRTASEARHRAEAALADLRRAQAAMDRDLAEARRLQRSLVPSCGADLGPVRIGVLYESCGEVGGDLVGWFRLGHGRVGAWAIDVSGHGVGAALMTARLKGF
ncbi:MAG: response regulator, partial [Hasllibacter sp.]